MFCIFGRHIFQWTSHNLYLPPAEGVFATFRQPLALGSQGGNLAGKLENPWEVDHEFTATNV